MQVTFSSQGKNIRMDVALPSMGGKQPAVLVLHGSGGISDIPEHVRDLSAHGYIRLAPHYFQSTGTSWADPNSIRQYGLTWGRTILDAAEFARRLPKWTPNRLAYLVFPWEGIWQSQLPHMIAA